jgi:transposase
VTLTDLFGTAGREVLKRLTTPTPWASSAASVVLIDQLDHQIAEREAELRRLGADHRYMPLLRTPGIGWVLATTIAAEIGQIWPLPRPNQLARYASGCPFVMQSGERDRRGPLTKHGPGYLSWR